MMFCCPLEHVGTQNPLPGGLQLRLLYVNCGHSCGRGPAPDALGHGAGSDHCGGGGGCRYSRFPVFPHCSPGMRVGRAAAQRPRATLQTHAPVSHSPLTPRPAWKTQLCPSHGPLAQGPGTSQLHPLLSVSRAPTSVQVPLPGQR